MTLTPELFLVYGFAFLALGGIAFIQPRDPKNLPVSRYLWLFGLFGLLHGGKEIYDAWLLSMGTYDRGLDRLGGLLLLISYVPLFEYGRRAGRHLLQGRSTPQHLLSGPLAYVCVGAAMGAFVLTLEGGMVALTAASRYFLGGPAALLAAWVFTRPNKYTHWSHRTLGLSLVCYGIFGGLVVEPVPGLPAFLPNTENVMALFGIPVQVVRMLCAIGVFVSLAVAARHMAMVIVRDAEDYADKLERANQTLEAKVAKRNRALVESERRLLEAERIAKMGAWRSDFSEGLYWSPELMEMMGVAPEDFTGDREFFYSMVHPDDLAEVRIAIAEAQACRESFDLTHRMVRTDGEVVTMNHRGELLLDEHGEIVGLVGILQDISEKLEFEERLRHAQKMETVGNLTGGVAHDFNNLLAVILGNLELVKDDPSDPGNDVLVDAAIGAALRGANLTKSMLSFARRAPLEPETVDLNQQVKETRRLSERVLPSNIEVETSLLASLWKTEADPNSTQSALLNLLLNARDAMPDGGRLTVETANVRIDSEYVETRHEEMEPGRYVMLAVSDTGQGIAKADLDKIFDPFFTTKGPGKGSGLGLSMIQGFMKQSGGTVRVYSEPGVGTTFKLYFRAVSPEAQPSSAGRELVERRVTKGTRLLMVEDEPGVLEVLATMLGNAGYVIDTATTGDAAYEMFAADPSYDLLLTDIVMPGSRKGTDLAKDLRKHWPHLPVVFMSGYASEATVHGNGLRPEDIRLMKPVRKAELIDAVETALAPITARN